MIYGYDIHINTDFSESDTDCLVTRDYLFYCLLLKINNKSSLNEMRKNKDLFGFHDL